MPRLSGFDVAASLKNDPEHLGIPIMMLTIVDDAQRAYGLGVDRYLTKPFEPGVVASQVEELIAEGYDPGIVQEDGTATVIRFTASGVMMWNPNDE